MIPVIFCIFIPISKQGERLQVAPAMPWNVAYSGMIRPIPQSANGE